MKELTGQLSVILYWKDLSNVMDELVDVCLSGGGGGDLHREVRGPG